MERRRLLARWLVVAALACFGLTGLLGAAQAQEGETAVQGTQSSTDADAETGTANGSNSNTLSGGPNASGSTAGANQIGSNRVTVSQSGSAKSGDPVAGAQVTGAVADNVTVQNQNASTDARAQSGSAVLTNDSTVSVGPTANSNGGPAQSAQTGSNSVDMSQVGLAITGDAVAGSQVTGIVGGGEHVVQNQNASSCDTTEIIPGGDLDARQVPGQCALSGNAIVTNTASFHLGPLASSDGLDAAQAGQIGDNDAVLSQSAAAHTGDALEGSQVVGIVGGSATVQQQNSSDISGTGAVSGTATASNVAGDTDLSAIFSNVGPFAFGSPSQASQNGDNAVDVAQDATGSSGDALGGSQVTGAVGDQGGFLTVQNQQASENDLSVPAGRSGDVFVGNARVTFTGPVALAFGPRIDSDAQASQVGDNSVVGSQIAHGSTGDALAGAQVTGAVGYTDVTVQNQNASDLMIASTGNVFGTAGPFVDAGNFAVDVVGPVAVGFGFVTTGFTSTGVDEGNSQASQNGDNAVDVAQAFTATTGDAVGGGQVTGVVATDGANVTIQNQNDANEPGAESGSVLTELGNAYVSLVGPISIGSQASHIGDSTLAVDQAFLASTGDVVAGSQVTGVVAGDGSDITIQNQNHSALSEPVRSGSVVFDVGNALIGLFGPLALGDEAQAAHFGDTVADLSQSLHASTGDALAGAQVTGTVAGDASTTTIQNQNTSDVDTAFSGDVIGGAGNVATNSLEGADEFLGDMNARSIAIGGSPAQASQIGDNLVSLDQSMAVSTGDAVAGSQVTGSVTGAGSEVTVQNQNFGEAAQAFSGDVEFDFLANAAALQVGPVAIALEEDGTAQASQNGDNVVDVHQALDVQTGDAVAGSQVTGVVAGPGSDVTVQNQNVATLGTIAESGNADVGIENLLQAELGPQATADGTAQAEQIGDNWLAFEQHASVSSGDAVAGSQVTGIVGPSDATVQTQNTADEPVALSGIVDGVNTASGALTAQAESFSAAASAQQYGDSGFDGVQHLDTASGDAVAGGQVSGIVGSHEAEFGEIAGVAAAA